MPTRTRPETKAVLAEIGEARLCLLSENAYQGELRDDAHDAGEIAAAAGCYALFASDQLLEAFHQRRGSTVVPVPRLVMNKRDPTVPDAWPAWTGGNFYRLQSREALVAAAALCIAEIERLDRLAVRKLKESGYGR